jgi:hypothetical protein
VCCAETGSCADIPDLTELIGRLPRGLAGIGGVLGQLAWNSITPDSLLGRIINCVSRLSVYYTRRLPQNSFSKLTAVAFANQNSNAEEFGSAQQQYDAFCRFVLATRALFTQDPLNTRCALVETLNKIECPPVNLGETDQAYAMRLNEPMLDVTALIVQYILDCVCESLMPPCSPDPVDPRLILACVTVKDDKILRICNFACRKYAGSFPALAYWLSAVPIIPLIGTFVKLLCCAPDLVRAQSPLVNDLLRFIQTIDPTGTRREAVFADDFALPRSLVKRASNALNSIDVNRIVSGGPSAQETELASLRAEVTDLRQQQAATDQMRAQVAQLEARQSEIEDLRQELQRLRPQPRRSRQAQVRSPDED